MDSLPSIVQDSLLWKSTLAEVPGDNYSQARDRLRSSFQLFRKRAAMLAGEIRGSLPKLTMHDVSHLDALWDSSATIVGAEYLLTPAEGFVLGGAFLLHDLGMALPTIEGGIDALKLDPRWSDLVTYEYRNEFDRSPSPEEVKDPADCVFERVLMSLLQQIHASNAERLAFLAFESTIGDIYLIDDADVRQSFGRIIGQVAHSHWWTVAELEKRFPRPFGAAHWCPKEWIVDPLKLACILRCADAAQIDGRRAPLLLKSVSRVSGKSGDHWSFQEKLNKPYLADDALVFTSSQAFRVNEASAWWTYFEMLKSVDGELGSVDALLADKGLPRFSARRVAGIEDPERLVPYVHTDGWIPINAVIHVTDLPKLVRNLGGEELYGKKPEVALRELIQNASDAIRARRVFEKRDDSFGLVKVNLQLDAGGGWWLEVQDNGVGMSQSVLTSVLLDFGKSFWGSHEMQKEFPGLLSSGIKQTGRYGIGFFSVFMISDEVQIISRRCDSASIDSMVLEFSDGLRGRPILRRADKSEQLLDCGTLVRMKLSRDPKRAGGLLFDNNKNSDISLVEMCGEMCPSLSVNLEISEDGNRTEVIQGGDWISMDGAKFLERFPPLDDDVPKGDLNAFRAKAAKNLRVLRDENGEVVGRALISRGYSVHDSNADLCGTVTVGGFHSCGLTGIVGVLLGRSLRASRDMAIPLVSNLELKRWAEEQCELIPDLWDDIGDQAGCAQYVLMCGGNTGVLKVCQHGGDWYSFDEIVSGKLKLDEFVLLDELSLRYGSLNLSDFKLLDNAIVVKMFGHPGLLQCDAEWPNGTDTNYVHAATSLADTLGWVVLEAFALQWGVSMEILSSANDLGSTKNVQIGTASNKEIMERGIEIRRPS